MTSPAHRDRNGIYHIDEPLAPDGDFAGLGVTTALAKGMATPFQLERWKTNQGIEVGHALGITDPDLDTATLRRKANAELDANKKATFAKGDAIHAAAERLLRGQPLDEWDQMYPAQVEGAAAFIRESGIEPLYIEQTVFRYDPAYAGTPDFFGRIDGRLGIYDWKSGSPTSAFSDKTALQLAAYMHAEWIINADGTAAEPLNPLDIDEIGVVHLPDDGGYVFRKYEADPGELFAAFTRVLASAYMNIDGIPGTFDRPVNFADIPAYRLEVRDRLAQLIEWGGGEDMAAAWPKGIPTFRDTDRHTTRQLDAIEYALRRVEYRHRPAPPKASAERHDELIAALTDHPYLDVIATFAAALEVPNLRGYAASVEQLDALERIVTIVTKVPDPEDRAARLFRASKGRTTNPADATAEDVEAFLRTRSSRKVSA